MAQGQSISLLVRIFKQTNNDIYLKSSINGIKPFEVDIQSDGVSSYFMNMKDLVWYQEYPTHPSSIFVLNGFIYSLFGLYDLYYCLNEQSNYKNEQHRVQHLFDKGLQSLLKMINLYDTGSRTIYDLKHLINAKINPNIARWDYHKVHTSQLYYLIQMLKSYEPIDYNTLNDLKSVADRWNGYNYGKSMQNSQIKL
jgi:heparosan-N-sulfate-glucuronate 5-epimerase